jgi:hypothetical protein
MYGLHTCATRYSEVKSQDHAWRHDGTLEIFSKDATIESLYRILVGWLVGWLDGWMVGWLVSWLISRPIVQATRSEATRSIDVGV